MVEVKAKDNQKRKPPFSLPVQLTQFFSLLEVVVILLSRCEVVLGAVEAVK